MGNKNFSFLGSIVLVLVFVVILPAVTASERTTPMLDISERFLSWAVEGNQEDAQLGTAVGSAGDVNGDGFDDLIVGAARFDTSVIDAGRAYLFLGSSTGLGTSPAWHADGTTTGGGLGWLVAGAGDVNRDGFDDVLVGDLLYTEKTFYLYLGNASGLSATSSWSTTGSTAAGAGDVNGDGYDDIVVGWEYYSNGQSLEGVAWVFLGSPAGPNASPNWMVESNQPGAQFGHANRAGDVNADGYEDILVGAPGYGSDTAYLYLGSSTGPATTPAWTTTGGSNFGTIVGPAGDTNGDGYDDALVATEGFVELFLGSSSGLLTYSSWSSGQGYWYLPAKVAAGDVNADGYDDLAVGMGYSGRRAFVHHGSASSLSQAPQWIAGWDYSVGPVATAGDVNGDGYSDLVVGLPAYSGDLTWEGQVRVYHGSYYGLSGTIAGYHLAMSPTIDGDLSDWGLQTPLVLDSDTAQTVLLRGAQTTPPLPADSSANLRAGWDADALYLAVHVVDDRIINDSSDVWRDDEIELAFDGNHNGSSSDSWDHQYTVNADGRLTDRAVPAPPGVTVAVAWVSGGWDVEVRIARSALSATPWQAGRTFGFSLGLHDDDDFDDWDSYLIWAGDDTASGAQGFATLRLIAGDAPPPATSTPTATATSTSTNTPTPTVTRSPTNTPTPTQTNTSTATATRTSTPTATSTSIATRLPTRYLPLILHRSP